MGYNWNMRLYFCRTMLRLNLGFSATLSAALSIGGGALDRSGPAEILRNFAAGLQVCLPTVGLAFALLVFNATQAHTKPLYLNLGIGEVQRLALAAGSALAAALALGLVLLAWPAGGGNA